MWLVGAQVAATDHHLDEAHKLLLLRLGQLDAHHHRADGAIEMSARGCEKDTLLGPPPERAGRWRITREHRN
jgi:hypothetical protein